MIFTSNLLFSADAYAMSVKRNAGWWDPKSHIRHLDIKHFKNSALVFAASNTQKKNILLSYQIYLAKYNIFSFTTI